MDPVTVYYVVHALSILSMSFVATTYVPYLLHIGLTLSDVLLVNNIFHATIVVVEIPTGLRADTNSRAWSIRLGLLLFGIGSLAFAGATNITTVIICEITVGFGQAFLSGALQAWLVDSLAKGIDKSDQKQVAEVKKRQNRIFGNAQFLCMGLASVTGMLGAIIGRWGLQLPFVAGALCPLVALLLTSRKLGETGEPVTRVSANEALKESIRAMRRQYSLRWLIALSIAFALVFSFDYYWAPYFREQIGEVETGFLWVPMHVTMALAGLLARRVAPRGGVETAALALMLLVVGVGMVGAGNSSVASLSIGFVLLHEIGRGFQGPAIEAFIQARIKGDHYRATYRSVHSFLVRLGNASVLFVFWFFMDRQSDTHAITFYWSLCGGLLCAFAVLFFLLRPRR